MSKKNFDLTSTEHEQRLDVFTTESVFVLYGSSVNIFLPTTTCSAATGNNIHSWRHNALTITDTQSKPKSIFQNYIPLCPKQHNVYMFNKF